MSVTVVIKEVYQNGSTGYKSYKLVDTDNPGRESAGLIGNLIGGRVGGVVGGSLGTFLGGILGEEDGAIAGANLGYIAGSAILGKSGGEIGKDIYDLLHEQHNGMSEAEKQAWKEKGFIPLSPNDPKNLTPSFPNNFDPSKDQIILLLPKSQSLPTPKDFLFLPKNAYPTSNINDLWNLAKNWIARRDPLVLDLDGDGIETVGVNATTHILFDHNNDGITTGTGWVKGEDGLLVLDRNGNGVIDNGSELFGDSTTVNGVKATDGFSALRAEDSNHNGTFNAGDTNFTTVEVWQDKNQDGISQTNELHTLSEVGIKSINLASTATSGWLEGATQTATGTFTRTDGTKGEVGNLNFASNAFYFSRHPELVSGSQSADHVRNERDAVNNLDLNKVRGVA